MRRFDLDENSIDILLSRILRSVMIQIQTNGGQRYQSLNIILYNITITRQRGRCILFVLIAV